MSGTQDDTSKAADEKERRRRKIQQQLDDALANTFPASDPVAIVTSQDEEWDSAAPAAPAEPTPSPKP